MGEIFKPVTQWIAGNVGWSVLLGFFILSLFFEFSKIKLSPITALFKWIGNRITSGLRADIASLDLKIQNLQQETDKKFDEVRDSVNKSVADLQAETGLKDLELKKQLREIEERQDRQSAARIKAHVFTFSRECRKGESHTLEDFENIVRENQEYESLVEKRGWKNDVYKLDFDFIMTDYNRRKTTGDFLR